jgi:hypothetical protein
MDMTVFCAERQSGKQLHFVRLVIKATELLTDVGAPRGPRSQGPVAHRKIHPHIQKARWFGVAEHNVSGGPSVPWSLNINVIFAFGGMG